MHQNIENFLNKSFLSTLLLSLLPISFILGNLAINFNIVLIIFLSLFIFVKDDLKFKLIFFDKLLLIYFFYIFLIGLLNYVESIQISQNSQIIIKSIFYFRYLMLYFAVRFLIFKNLINFKNFFYICSLCVLFVSLDIIYQFNFGKDIFGFEGVTRRLSGPFGDELVAGSYLYRFSFFLIFLFFTLDYFKKINGKIKFLLFCIISIIISLGLILAGNRVPFFIFLFTAILIFLINKKDRLYFLSLFIISVGTLMIMVNLNLEIKKHYGHFQTKIINLFNPFSSDKIIIFKDNKNPTPDEKNYTITLNGKNYSLSSGHVKEFYSGYKTWYSNKFLGGGVKTFRFNCPKVFHNCNTHPHNYYLEILTDLGAVGLLMVFSFFIFLIYKSLLINNTTINPFLFVFIGEILPFKSTGSFFTTSNSTYIFLLIAVIISISVKKRFELNL